MKNSNYNARDFLKDRTRIFHRMESEDNPGTIQIIDSSGKLVTPERLESIKKFESEIVVIDITTTANSELFT